MEKAFLYAKPASLVQDCIIEILGAGFCFSVKSEVGLGLSWRTGSSSSLEVLIS